MTEIETEIKLFQGIGTHWPASPQSAGQVGRQEIQEGGDVAVLNLKAI